MLNKLVKEYEDSIGCEIQQMSDEIEMLMKEIGDRKFESMAEIGVADGGSLWLYTNLFGKEGGRCTVTDMDIRPTAKKVMAAITERMGIQFKVVQCLSHNFILKEPVGFLHIDGDHRYKSVKHDYYINGRAVVPGGIIVMHDTVSVPGPIQFREELERNGVPTKTFRGYENLCSCFGPNKTNPNRRSLGMTIVYKEKND